MPVIHHERRNGHGPKKGQTITLQKYQCDEPACTYWHWCDQTEGPKMHFYPTWQETAERWTFRVVWMCAMHTRKSQTVDRAQTAPPIPTLF
jgi:hypothetical protein